MAAALCSLALFRVQKIAAATVGRMGLRRTWKYFLFNVIMVYVPTSFQQKVDLGI
jgi:hypothetical protein